MGATIMMHSLYKFWKFKNCLIKETIWYKTINFLWDQPTLSITMTTWSSFCPKICNSDFSIHPNHLVILIFNLGSINTFSHLEASLCASVTRDVTYHWNMPGSLHVWDPARGEQIRSSIGKEACLAFPNRSDVCFANM